LVIQSNEQLDAIISDVKGKVPTFGYPLIHYSPRQSPLKLTDSTVWKHAIVSDGQAIKNLKEEEFKMVSTAQLKLELTEKMDKAVARGGAAKAG